MANPEHLKILKQSVDAWNQWREENLDVIPDLSGADLSGANIEKANLRRADLAGVILYRAKLLGVDLSDAVIVAADLEQARFGFVNLSRASFIGSSLNGAFFYEANLIGTLFYPAYCEMSVFADCDLTGANFGGAVLRKANFTGSRLCSADFRMAKLRGAILRSTDLIGAKFKQADLSGADLGFAQLQYADFTKAELTGVNIEDCPIDKSTIFDCVTCKYIYLQKRLPSDRNFEPGEFTKLFQADRSYSKLSVLETLINRFEKLLDDYPQGHESLFHEFLIQNPALLDVYGEPDSKPKFPFPEGESPLDKNYVEPDVIIKYPNNKYKLVELERPGKHWGTKQGQTTSELNQAAFQACSEWDYYIRNHYDLIKDKYPGISNHRSYMVVIGRKTHANVGGRNPEEYRQYIAGQYPCEICFYDDLLDKAKQAHAALVALSL
jgi:uncharacterized protein YjbI with pentapeptide repeats